MYLNGEGEKRPSEEVVAEKSMRVSIYVDVVTMMMTTLIMMSHSSQSIEMTIPCFRGVRMTL